MLGRDVCLMGASFYIRFVSLQAHFDKVTWREYWDFGFPTVEVKPTVLSKVGASFHVFCTAIAQLFAAFWLRSGGARSSSSTFSSTSRSAACTLERTPLLTLLPVRRCGMVTLKALRPRCSLPALLALPALPAHCS